MKHALRKYISPCGSALFMVVSTMAALIVLVTAMYMSVLSSRQVQYATFDQEQAYVTSTSVGDMVYSYISENMTGTNEIVKAITSLSKGDSISTNGNGFKAFGGDADDDILLGAYDVSITYVYDLSDQRVYDLAVTVENNGVFETTHAFLKLSFDGDLNMRRIDNFFTSTGYLPTDIWIKKVISDSQMYFDNEYVKMSEHKLGSSSEACYNYSITALGSLDIDVGKDMSDSDRPEAPLTWVIGNNLTITKNDLDIDLAGNHTTHGRIIVGRNMYLEGTQRPLKQYTDIYVLGNLYLNSNLEIGGNIYVEGDLIVNRIPGSISAASEICVNGSVVDGSGNPVNLSTTVTTWDSTDIKTELLEKLNPSEWPVWSVAENSTVIDIDFTKSTNNVVFIDKDGTLGNWKNVSTGDQNNHVIIIDTGKNETDVRTLTISANDDKGESFSWNPWDNGQTMVCTVGKGSLVINVPDDVVYQAKREVFFGNIAWMTTLGGTITYASDPVPTYTFSDRGTVFTNGDNFLPICKEKHYIYDASDFKMCNGDLDQAANIAAGACDYYKVTTSINIDGKEEKRVHYTCRDHGGWYDVDQKTGICEEVEEYYAGNCDSLCIGRLNHSAFDTFYGTPDGTAAKRSLIDFYTNYYGITEEKAQEYIYPNVNIFIASDYENAQINFGKSEYVGDIRNSLYFGYLYAPYMTFSFDGQSTEDTSMRAMGGLVVSDIILSSGTGFLFAQPDISIPGLVGENWTPLYSLADKSWRLSYGLT